MKWVFIGLLLLNIGFLTWHARSGEPVDEVEVAEEPIRGNVSRLLLRTEVAPSELRERATPRETAPQSGTAEAREIANRPTETDGPGQEGAQVSPPEAPPKPLPQCFSVGPLKAQSDITAVEAWLEREGGDGILRADERREIAAFWVYVPPLPDYAAARAKAGELTKNGIEDIHVLRKGDMANAISLGVYGRLSAAARRKASLEKMGYDVSIGERYRSQKASWIDAEFAPDFEFPRAAFDQLFPSIQATNAACATQARS